MQQTLTSGSMAAVNASGFRLSSLETHTEARMAIQISLGSGVKMIIEDRYPHVDH